MKKYLAVIAVALLGIQNVGATNTIDIDSDGIRKAQAAIEPLVYRVCGGEDVDDGEIEDVIKDHKKHLNVYTFMYATPEYTTSNQRLAVDKLWQRFFNKMSSDN